MRPTSVRCVWCGAHGVALRIPGSVCHDCRAAWCVLFEPEMSAAECEDACARLGRTVAQVFGSSLIRFAFEDALAEDGTIEDALDKVLDEIHEEIAQEVDREFFASLDSSVRSMLQDRP